MQIMSEEHGNGPTTEKEPSGLLKVLQAQNPGPANGKEMDRLVQEILSVLPRVKPAVYGGDLSVSVYMEEVIEK